jgi:hypothetical protein
MNQLLIEALTCKLFATRDSLKEAYDEAIAQANNDTGVIVAIHVLMNTIANKIDKEYANA